MLFVDALYQIEVVPRPVFRYKGKLHNLHPEGAQSLMEETNANR